MQPIIFNLLMSSSFDGYYTTLPNGSTVWVPTQTILTGSRQRGSPQRYSDETYTPGANNGYTAGRNCDQYDRSYNGNNFYEDDESDFEDDEYYSDSDDDDSDFDMDDESDDDDSDWDPDDDDSDWVPDYDDDSDDDSDW